MLPPAFPHCAPLPRRAVLLPTAAFSTNKRGYPALSRRHQELLADCFRRGVQVGGLGWLEATAGCSGARLLRSLVPRVPAMASAAPLQPPDKTDNHRSDMQVVLSGAAHHTPPPAGAADSSGSGGGSSGTAVAVGPDGGVAAVGEQHPLRPYWEYLSYCFRCDCTAVLLASTRVWLGKLPGRRVHVPPAASCLRCPSSSRPRLAGCLAPAAAAQHTHRITCRPSMHLDALRRKLAGTSEQELVEMSYRDYLQVGWGCFVLHAPRG